MNKLELTLNDGNPTEIDQLLSLIAVRVPQGQVHHHPLLLVQAVLPLVTRLISAFLGQGPQVCRARSGIAF